MSSPILSHTDVLNRGVAEVLPARDTLAALMQEKKIRVYLGIDPTGAFLTLGHSVVLRKLQQFADLGHEVILLIGNGTVRIGDPTGRDSSRPVLTDEQIREHFKHWQEQASKILNFDKIKVMYNGDWLDKLGYVDIIKLMAQVTVQQLIERDMFQERLKKGLPIFGHEIMYPLLQGYDSVVMDVDLELGGTDQTFNMLVGRQLQKSYHNKEKWVLSMQLINGTDGRKMSKSFNNYIALTEAPNDMYGKLMRTADDMIIEYFTVLTDVRMDEVDSMSTAMAEGTNPMEFKKRLAFTITEMYHSTTAAQTAQEFFEKTAQNREAGEPLEFSVDEDRGTIIDFLKNAPTSRSRSDLRRLIEQGGITVYFKDGREEKLADVNQVYLRDTIENIRVGKREFYKPISNHVAGH